ncbi:cytochrome C [Bacillus xiapuensis]|uniref:Cytochrome C n=1 Tax=Bacillus xiapuensis TaxID=2014075 RepID=A0ABU6N471_9BACI|nr:cytochrome C [Bacillus xiapuensis]
MNKAIINFVISLLIGFGLGYLVFDVIMKDSGPQQPQIAAHSETGANTTAKNQGSESKQSAVTTTAADPDNILSKRGCLGCHSVEALNLKGGQVGPDLSHAFVEVKDKHGMPIEKFLTKPNSAVMSGVLGKNPLTDNDRKQVLELLKKASEK